MLGWFADAPNPDHGLLAFRQVSEALGNTPWYLRALRDEGMMAERLARILASSRYAVPLLTRAPQTVQMLADDEELRPRSQADLRAEMHAAAGRQATRSRRWRPSGPSGAASCSGSPPATCWARTTCSPSATALTDLASATIDATLEVARRGLGGRTVPEIAVIAMGRWGGRELSYASDADAMFVMEDERHRSARPDQDRRRRDHRDAQAARPGPAPTRRSSIDADLRPEGKGGALIRSLRAYRNYYSRWSSTWEMQALVRADALAGNSSWARLLRLIDAKRWPEGGLTPAQLSEIRKLKARVEAERLPRGANPAKHTKLGPGGLADVEWTVQLLQLQHAHRLPALRTPKTIVALRAARDAGLISTPSTPATSRRPGRWPAGSATRSCWSAVAGRTRCRPTLVSWRRWPSCWATGRGRPRTC